MQVQTMTPTVGKADVVALVESGLEFGREICCELRLAEEREWIVTNGIGGFAFGTVAGSLTRRYHGLLIAALDPPLGRTLMAAKLDEDVEYDGHTYPLYTNRWSGGTLAPEGCPQIEQFRLDDGIPTWTFAMADALIEKRITMCHGSNTTVVEYRLLRASASVRMWLKALVNYRDFHHLSREDNWQFDVEEIDSGLTVKANQDAAKLYLYANPGTVTAEHTWHRGFSLLEERRRGMDSQEDHLHAGTISVDLEPGVPVRVVLSTEEGALRLAENAFGATRARVESLLERFESRRTSTDPAPGWIRQLAIAADQFIVRREAEGAGTGYSIIAGYPWFSDWGRDVMVALPGLTLATGRAEIARGVLRMAAGFVRDGLLPNQFPSSRRDATFNSVDAALWYIEAARQYYEETKDRSLLDEIWPALVQIGEKYTTGTRFGIGVDPADGLLRAGQVGVQVTWMDAKIGDWVITPRQGKPVEVNALWLNANVTLGQFARILGQPAGPWDAAASKARASFTKFWNEKGGYCFDTIDGPEGNDDALRPNQVIALALPECPLTEEQQRSIVQVTMRRLLTSYGLRTLSPDHAEYVGSYEGDLLSRDSSYHQGTAWAWLIGPFLIAHLRAFRDPEAALQFLRPMARQTAWRGLGTIAELFDGDPPFHPRGAVAQAWSVSEVLRAWTLIDSISGRQERLSANPQG